ncbi:MAG: sugar ABC transporter permease [Ruminococcus sp.]|uniref:Sugar ABC transporter permease n=1 Tax=Schaedlerella arabinosiphila TaxID=2044587 RepID=A0A426DMW1_9FIRM|nr:sugar ABC transporter permease [Schaedlerella arabinosiphila]MCI8723923.1 sugar ABC transporter permease [Ruminococcus sp.]RRK34127.1 sugar ABC transporter permease [Schaedlerella arabinosiphila]
MSRKRKGCRRAAPGVGERWGLVFVLPSLMGVLVFYAVPYLDVIRRSFVRTLTGEFTGIENFRLVLGNPAFRLAAANTGKMMAVSVPVLVVFSLMLAVPLQKGVPGGRWFKSGLLIPMAIPVASVVLLWQCIFAKQGFLNGFLNLFGIPGTDWMNTKYAFAVLVFSYVWKNLGYSVILWIAALEGIPAEINEAARMDGAGEWVIFFRITIPNLFSALFTITVLSLINSFKVFREAYLVAGDYPDESIYMLQHLFNNWYRNLDVDKMAAGAVLSGTVLLILVCLFWRKWEGEEV